MNAIRTNTRTVTRMLAAAGAALALCAAASAAGPGKDKPKDQNRARVATQQVVPLRTFNNRGTAQEQARVEGQERQRAAVEAQSLARARIQQPTVAVALSFRAETPRAIVAAPAFADGDAGFEFRYGGSGGMATALRGYADVAARPSGAYGGPVFVAPCTDWAGTLTINGREFVMRTNCPIGEQIVNAFECAGYDAWCDGPTVKVRQHRDGPDVCWRSGAYRVRLDDCGRELTLSPSRREVCVPPPVVCAPPPVCTPPVVYCPPPVVYCPPPVVYCPPPVVYCPPPVTCPPPLYDRSLFGIHIVFGW